LQNFQDSLNTKTWPSKWSNNWSEYRECDIPTVQKRKSISEHFLPNHRHKLRSTITENPTAVNEWYRQRSESKASTERTVTPEAQNQTESTWETKIKLLSAATGRHETSYNTWKSWQRPGWPFNTAAFSPATHNCSTSISVRNRQNGFLFLEFIGKFRHESRRVHTSHHTKSLWKRGFQIMYRSNKYARENVNERTSMSYNNSIIRHFKSY
jgi:hypothetical protein